jgi:hypothetical protein
VKAIDQEIAVTRSRLEEDLVRGPDALRPAAAQVVSVRQAVWPMLEVAVRDLAQAEADLHAIT